MKNKKMWIVIAAAAVLLVVVILAVFNMVYPSRVFGRVYRIGSNVYSDISATYPDIPEYHLTKTGDLYKMNYSSDTWEYVGPLKPVQLTEDNFDKLFTKNWWNGGLNEQTVRERTVSAWSCTKTMEKVTRLHYVLLLENGSIFLCSASEEYGMGEIISLHYWGK